MRVLVDLNRCSGYGNCVMESPDVFDIDEATNLVTVLQTEPGEERRAEVTAAMRACPVRAISIEE